MLADRARARRSVVDFLDVALRARSADDVGGIVDPAFEPVEAPPGSCFPAAPRRRGNRECARSRRRRGSNCRRGPDRAVAGGVELAGDDARREAAVGGENLVGADHREAVAKRERDAGRNAGEFRRQFDDGGSRRAAAARRVVEPVDAEEVERMGRVGVDSREARGDRRRIVEGPSVRRKSAGRRPPRGNARASACRPRRRPDGFPARVAPCLVPHSQPSPRRGVRLRGLEAGRLRRCEIRRPENPPSRGSGLAD